MKNPCPSRTGQTSFMSHQKLGGIRCGTWRSTSPCRSPFIVGYSPLRILQTSERRIRVRSAVSVARSVSVRGVGRTGRTNAKRSGERHAGWTSDFSVGHPRMRLKHILGPLSPTQTPHQLTQPIRFGHQFQVPCVYFR